jgi:hypothetical protein
MTSRIYYWLFTFCRLLQYNNESSNPDFAELVEILRQRPGAIKHILEILKKHGKDSYLNQGPSGDGNRGKE